MGMEMEQAVKALYKCDFYHLTEETVEDKILAHLPQDFNYEYHTGATKLVLIFDDFDYVIKIPFFGCLLDCGEYCEFSGGGGDLGEDYCDLERANYQSIQFDYPEIEDLFAETELFGFMKDYPIYIQKKVDTEIKSSFLTDKQKEKTREICNEYDYDCFNVTWLTDVIIEYGLEVLDELFAAIKELNINDLSHNCGYTFAGKPCLYDYSGYYDY